MDRLSIGVLDSLFPLKWRSNETMLVDPATTLADLAPQADGSWGAILNGKMVRSAEWENTVVNDQDSVIYTPLPQDFVTAGLLWLAEAIAYAVVGTVVAYGLGKAFGLMEVETFEGDDTTTYSFQNLQQTQESGRPIKIVYGTHPLAGNVLEMDIRKEGTYGTKLDMVIGLAEGEITSIDSISVNGNDVVLDTTDAAFGTVATPTYNLGTNTQTALGTDGTSTTQDVGLNMSILFTDGTGGNTVTYTTTEDVDRFRLNILFPQGLYRSDGASRLMTFRYRYRNTADAPGAFTGYFDVQVTSNKVGAFVHSIEVEPVDGSNNPRRGTYEIELRQINLSGSSEVPLSPDHGGGGLTSELDNVVEIQNQLFTYPNIATLRMQISASSVISGSSLPNVIATVTGRKIQKWDGVSLTNPNFVDAEPNAPAWIIYDLLTNSRYGLGAWVDSSLIDLTSFQNFQSFCDELVDNGQGATEKRAVFDGVFDGSVDAWQAVQRVASTARGVVYTVGEAIKIKYESPRPITQMFTMGNIVEGSWQQGYVSRLERPTRLEATFLNKDNGYQPDVVGIDDPDATDLPYRVSRIELPGIVRESQALREARFRMNVEKLGETVAFEADIDAVACEPGDLIRVSHDVPQWGTSGRVVSATSTTVTLDQDVVLEAGTDYSITIRHPDDTRTTTTLTSAAGTYAAGAALTVSSWATTPAEYDLYAIGPFEVTGKDVVVTSIRTTGDLKRAIEGVVYNEAIHEDTVATGTTAFKSAIAFDEVPGDVTRLTAREPDADTGMVTLSWEYPVGLIQSAQVFQLDGVYTPVTTVPWPISQVEVPITATDESITFAVVAVAPSGDAQAPADAAQVSIRPGMHGVIPNAVTGITATQDDDVLRLAWTGMDDIARYEVRRGLNWVGSLPVGSTTEPEIRTTEFCPTLSIGLTESYWVRPVSNAGKFGRVAKYDETNTLAIWTGGSYRSESYRGWTAVTASNMTTNADGDLEISTAGTEAKLETDAYDIGTNAQYRIGAILHTDISDDAWSADYAWQSKTGVARNWHGYTDPSAWNTAVKLEFATRTGTTGAFTDWRPMTTRIPPTSWRQIKLRATLTPANANQLIKIRDVQLLMEIL